MKYTKEQLNGQIFCQGGIEYIIEYLDGDNLQFYKKRSKTYKYKGGYNTDWINKRIMDGDRIIFIKPLEPYYEIF